MAITIKAKFISEIIKHITFKVILTFLENALFGKKTVKISSYSSKITSKILAKLNVNRY